MRLSAFLRGRVGAVLRYSLSGLLLGWLVTRIEWTRIGELDRLDWALALPAAAIAGVAYPLQAFRWTVFLRALGVHLPHRWVHGVFWIGQFYSTFLPGGVAADAVRLMHLWGAASARRAAGVASVVADRMFGFASLLTIATSALAMHLFGAGSPGSVRPMLAASAVASAVVLLLSWSLIATRWWEPLTRRVLGAERATALHDAAVALGTRRGALALGAGLSVLVWLLDFIAVWMMARAVGMSAGLLEISVAAAAAYVAATLPISIGGHGVREASLVGMLTAMGLTAGDGQAAALLALVFWILNVGWSLVGGIVQLAWLAPRRESHHPHLP